MRTQKVGRDAVSGRFVTHEETRRRPATTTLETIHIKRKGRRRGR